MAKKQLRTLRSCFFRDILASMGISSEICGSIMIMKPYPLKFAPVFKSTLWGGIRIARFKGIEMSRADIGESWEISAVEGSESVLDNGCYAGSTLPELVERFGESLLGSKVSARFGNRFPLLIKFLDANQDLSLQVHPNEQLARRRHNASGKSEMWYVVDRRPGTRIYAGFSRLLTPARFRALVDANNLLPSLGCYESCPGDVYYLAAGTIHGIGAGNFLVEIQESSDITYRVNDYGRKGPDGKPRELHIDKAIDVSNLTPIESDFKPCGPRIEDGEAETVMLATCEYFTTFETTVHGKVTIDVDESSFGSIIVVEGECVIRNEGDTIHAKKGDSIFVDAGSGAVEIEGNCQYIYTCE